MSIGRFACRGIIVIDSAINDWYLRLPACVQASMGGGIFLSIFCVAINNYLASVSDVTTCLKIAYAESFVAYAVQLV